MSIFRIFPDSIDTFTVNASPTRSFSSSSNGVTGSVDVFVRKSRIEKEVLDAASTISDLAPPNNDPTKDKLRAALLADPDRISLAPSSDKKNAVSLIKRIVPITAYQNSSSFDEKFLKKSTIKEVLQDFYRTASTSPNWGCTNYNSINFFTASSVPSDSVLMYPNVTLTAGHGQYELPDEMTFSFHINPRYKTKDFSLGTLFHLSSSYAVSLLTGSLKDENGFPIGFRLKLQLSHSADINPSIAQQGSYPNDLVFLSDDNSLSWNSWHHVAIRWGTISTDYGSGSFVIDGVTKGTFNVPSSSLMLPSSVQTPGSLFIGNYYTGPNTSGNPVNLFFSAQPATREGLYQLDSTPSTEGPTGYSFNHPLNAEVHDLMIHNSFLNDDRLRQLRTSGLSEITGTVFCLPPFYVNSSSYRQSLITPSLTKTVRSASPFNSALAFLTNGHEINLENYLKDFSSNNTPRLFNLTSSIVPSAGAFSTANEALNSLPSLRKRNLTILPCDDGKYSANYDLLKSETDLSRSIDDFGNKNLALINLSNIVSEHPGTGSYESHQNFIDGKAASDFYMDAIGPTPYNFTKALGTSLSGLTQFDDVSRNFRTSVELDVADSSSNQVVIFDVGNLFYGRKIYPGSIEIHDSSLTGSSGVVSMTIKDDGRGSLYRSDSITSASVTSNVGSVYYEDGLIIIKNPCLYFMGKDQFTISLRGDQNIHVLKIDALAPADHLNRSNNVQYNSLSDEEKSLIKPSGYDNDSDSEFVYVTGINIHDENLNIIMKSRLAQPILKRTGDRLMFKIKLDF